MHELTDDERSILHVYQVRGIKEGMGLTYDILRSELKYSLEDELEIVLLSLIEKGILIEFPFYRRLYQLTHTGHQALSSIDDTM